MSLEITPEEKLRRKYHRCLAAIETSLAAVGYAQDYSPDTLIHNFISNARGTLNQAKSHCHEELVRLGKPESEH